MVKWQTILQIVTVFKPNSVLKVLADILHGFHTQSIAWHFMRCKYFNYCLPVYTKVLPTVKLWPNRCVNNLGVL